MLATGVTREGCLEQAMLPCRMRTKSKEPLTTILCRYICRTTGIALVILVTALTILVTALTNRLVVGNILLESIYFANFDVAGC